MSLTLFFRWVGGGFAKEGDSFISLENTANNAKTPNKESKLAALQGDELICLARLRSILFEISYITYFHTITSEIPILIPKVLNLQILIVISQIHSGFHTPVPTPQILKLAPQIFPH